MKNTYLTITEAADYLRVKPATVSTWTRQGKIKFFQPQKKLLFREADLERFIEKTGSKKGA